MQMPQMADVLTVVLNLEPDGRRVWPLDLSGFLAPLFVSEGHYKLTTERLLAAGKSDQTKLLGGLAPSPSPGLPQFGWGHEPRWLKGGERDQKATATNAELPLGRPRPPKPRSEETKKNATMAMVRARRARAQDTF